MERGDREEGREVSMRKVVPLRVRLTSVLEANIAISLSFLIKGSCKRLRSRGSSPVLSMYASCPSVSTAVKDEQMSEGNIEA